MPSRLGCAPKCFANGIEQSTAGFVYPAPMPCFFPACALGLLALAGCEVEVPKVSSGYYAHGFTSPRSTNHVALSPEQIATLREWLGARSTGWKFGITDYAP